MSAISQAETLHRPGGTRRLVLATLIPLAAFGLQSVFWEAIQPYVWFLFYPAVFFSSWVGGLRGGLVATFLSTGLVWYFFIPPQFSFAVQRPMAFLSIATFTGMGFLFSLLHGRLRAANQQAVDSLAAARLAEDELEAQVLKRTADFRQANAALLESRAKLESALASMTDAVFISDKQGRFIEFNEAFATFHKFKNKQECAKTLAEYPAFLDVLLPGGELAPLEEWAVSRALRGETATNAEYTLRRKDTGETWVGSYSFGPIRDQAGAIVGSVVAGRDITESKRAEMALRDSEARRNLALDAARAGSWEWEIETGRNTWSEELWKLYGLVPHACEPSYEAWRQTVHPHDREAAERALQEIVRQEGEINLEWRVLDPGNGERWLMSRGRPLRDAAGRVTRYLGVVMDITERKRAEVETRRLSDIVQQEKDRLSSLVNSISDEVWFADTDNRFVLANPSALREFGLEGAAGIDVEQLAASLEVLRPDGTPRPVEEAPPLRALKGEIVRDLEEMIRGRASGELRYRLVSASPVRDTRGAIIGSVSVVHDITKRKRAEEALRKQNRFTQTILDHAPIGFAVNSISDGAFQYVNAHFEEVYGVPRGALRSVENFFELVYPDPVYREELRARIMADLASGDPTRMCWEDVPFTTRTGESKVVTAVNIPFPDQNLMVSTVMDVTHRKRAEAALRESEARLRALGDNLPSSYVYQYIHEVDGSPRFLYLSAGVEKLHGVKVSNVLRDADVLHRQIAPEQFPAMAAMEAASRQTLTDFEMELRMSGSDGQWRWLHLRSRPRLQPDGQILWEGVATDITARKEAEETIHQLNVELDQRVIERTAQLEAANKELEAFSYSVSHDLRAPLRHVHGYAEMLAEEVGDQLSEKSRRYLKTIIDASNEMSVLIDNLLAFSRMGRIEMREVSLELDWLVQEALRGLESATSGRNIVWKIPALPAVKGDPAMLKQVFANLLGNAVKYTRPRDPAVIEVGVMECESNGVLGTAQDAAALSSQNSNTPKLQDSIVFFVRDNGVGFDPQYAHKLFGVFQRLHRADQFEGTGIGLANVRRIIARHGGRTWAEGKMNEGAAFYFTLKPSAADLVK